MLKNMMVRLVAGVAVAGVALSGAAAYAGGNTTCSGSSVWGGESSIHCESSDYKPFPNMIPAAPFIDVAPDTPFNTEIAWMYESGIAKGWADGTYRPLAPVKRDAMIVFLYRLAGSPAYSPPKVSPFSDVPESYVFYKEIAWAYDNGITNGWGSGADREFRPQANVKRDAVAAFLYRYAGEPVVGAPVEPVFSDVSASNVFYKEIVWMEEAVLAEGWADGTYRPLDDTKRDAMAAFLFRAAVNHQMFG